MSWLLHLDKSTDQEREQRYRDAVATDPSFDNIPDHWELELLGVHPDFQRKGIGAKLLQYGFDRAREDKVPLILFATLRGEKLYLKLGFREVNRVTVDEEHDLKWAAMIWYPPDESMGQR